MGSLCLIYVLYRYILNREIFVLQHFMQKLVNLRCILYSLSSFPLSRYRSTHTYYQSLFLSNIFLPLPPFNYICYYVSIPPSLSADIIKSHTIHHVSLPYHTPAASVLSHQHLGLTITSFPFQHYSFLNHRLQLPPSSLHTDA